VTKKWLLWFGHINRMDRARIPKRALKLKFKEREM
jgi:hypothetical protein